MGCRFSVVGLARAVHPCIGLGEGLVNHKHLCHVIIGIGLLSEVVEFTDQRRQGRGKYLPR